MTVSDWIGFIGVSILLLAFILNLIGKIAQNAFPYLLMNFIGAALACLASVMIHYLPFVILEGVWTIFSFVACLRLLSKK